MKTWEKVLEENLREEPGVSENQFDFMLGKLTVEPIFFVRQSIEKYL